MDNNLKDYISQRKEEVAHDIDVALDNGEGPEDILVVMKEMLDHLKPITSMLDYVEDELED